MEVFTRLLAVAFLALAPAAPAPGDARLAERVGRLTRETRWTPTASIPVAFRTFHPQGMVRIGRDFYVSSVEIRRLPEKLPARVDGQDYDAGAGVGHLFRIGPDGRLLGDLVLGEGSIYHPGGIDFDGVSLWVPVAEYRPHSRAIIYRVDPRTLKAEEVFRFPDHIGGLVHDPVRHELHGLSWGSRRFYTWRLDGRGRPLAGAPVRITPNPEQYVDYQDCHLAGAGRMLCGGVGEYAAGGPSTPRGDAPVFQLGGLDLVDLATHRPVHQTPVELRSPSGRVMTQNPVWLEPTAAGLRAWFMPDDDRSTLFAYDADPPAPSPRSGGPG